MALVGDDAGDIPPLADAKDNRLRRQRLFGHAAEALHPHQAVRLDFADDKAELVHMGKEHHARAADLAGDGADQVAEPIGARVNAKPGQLCRQPAANATLMATQARNEHQLGGERQQSLLHRISRLNPCCHGP